MTLIPRLSSIVPLLVVLGIHAPALAEPQVSVQDVERYLASFATRPLPTVRAQANYQAMVAELKSKGKIAWYVGQWATKDGFIAVYPAVEPGTACLMIKTDRTVAFAEGRIDGAVLRTGNPLFTDTREQFLRYAASDVFVPVLKGEKALLVWGLYDQQKGRSRFLTLGFQNVPPDPSTFLPPGRTADAIKAQFAASGCQVGNRSPVVPQQLDRNAVVQTLDGVTTQIARTAPDEFQLQITNTTSQDFGFFPNRVVAYDQSNRRVPIQLKSLVHGTVLRPGGVLRATLRTFRQPPAYVQIPEATSQGRMFKLQLPK